MRLGKKDYTSESAQRYGPMFRWYHLDCFVANRDELTFHDKAADIPGYKTLRVEDRKELDKKLPKQKAYVFQRPFGFIFSPVKVSCYVPFLEYGYQFQNFYIPHSVI
jgi:hypothetical protein